MAIEAPQQIDFSKQEDITKLKKSLSPEEQNALDEYFDSEKEGIIYLTQQELGQLKSILGQDISEQHDWDFDDFIENQKTEGLSSADILEGVEGNLYSSEMLEGIDAASHELLFGEEGLFGGIEIDPIAQDHISVSLSISLLENIKTNPNFLSSIEGDAISQEEVMKLMISYNDSFKALGVALQEQNVIDGQGKNNGIFMETDTGKKFFNKLLSGEIDKSNIVDSLKEHNFHSEIQGIVGNVDTMQEIIKAGTLSLEDLTELREKIEKGSPHSKGTPDLTSEETNTPSSTPEETKKWLEEMKEKGGFAAVIAAVLEMLQGFIPEKMLEGSSKDNETPAYTGKEKQEEEEKNNTLISLIDELAETPVNAELVKTLKENPEKTTLMRLRLESISPNETFEETFQDLFGENVVDGKITNITNIFNEYGFLESLPASMNTFDKAMKLLEEYSRYRNSPGVLGKDSGRTPWKLWAEQRQSEYWKVGGR